MNPEFKTIGESFIQQYYTMFDSDIMTRASLANFYRNESMLTFEGQQFMGKEAIEGKLKSLTFQKINHAISSVDCQPTFDGGVVVMVVGQLKTDDDPPHQFLQTFVLKGPEFFVQHDLFRLCLGG